MAAVDISSALREGPACVFTGITQSSHSDSRMRARPCRQLKLRTGRNTGNQLQRAFMAMAVRSPG